jgi:hypothetical protein
MCAALAVLAVGLTGDADRIAAQAEPGVQGQALVSILVMGDSFSAGNGAGDYFGPRGCRRSARNYAREYERLIEQSPFSQQGFVEVVACSGAVTAHIMGNQGERPPQINAVNAGYDLIVLTLAGNDARFADIVRYCLVALTRDGANCGPNLARAERLLADGTIASRLTNALRQIRARADWRARIVLLGYPYLERDPNYRIRSGHGGSTFIEVGRRVRALTDRANQVQRSVINQLNAESGTNTFVFVPVHDLFRGHELYANRDTPDRWFIQPQLDGGLAVRDTWYHPNRTGHQQEARHLLRQESVPRFDMHRNSEGWWHFSFEEAPTIGVEFTLEAPRGGGVLQLTDSYCPGDRFRVRDNGQALRPTIDVPNLGCQDEIHADGPEESVGDLRWSQATYFLPRGEHQIVVNVLRNAAGTVDGGGFFRSSVPVTITGPAVSSDRPSGPNG